jgi:hypothetical protein
MRSTHSLMFARSSPFTSAMSWARPTSTSSLVAIDDIMREHDVPWPASRPPDPARIIGD